MSTRSATIAVIVGSQRKASFSRKIAQAAVDLSPKGLSFEFLDLGNLPIYNQDLDDEGATPATWTAFRDKVRGFDALLFVTPEHNRSVPALLKNALDIASRPRGRNVWLGKPGGVISISMGAIGGFGANHHLRQVLTAVGIPTLAHPEAYIGNVAALLDEHGKLINDGTRRFLTTFMEAFDDWIARNA